MTLSGCWPLSVDGLLLLATVGVLKPAHHASRRARWVVWLAFLLGIVVSLAANIAAAPALAWKPVLVAGWPPVALPLSVELLAHRPGERDRTESAPPIHIPTCAELDQVAGTNDYGRAALARWRRTGRVPAEPDQTHPNGISRRP